MNQTRRQMLANIKMNSTMLKMAHRGYTIHRDVASNAAITETPCAPVGIVLICGTEYVPCFLARSLSQRAICPWG